LLWLVPARYEYFILCPLISHSRYSSAIACGQVIKAEGLWLLDYWDCTFESGWGMDVCCL
jgi:hypothetical protein